MFEIIALVTMTGGAMAAVGGAAIIGGLIIRAFG